VGFLALSLEYLGNLTEARILDNHLGGARGGEPSIPPTSSPHSSPSLVQGNSPRAPGKVPNYTGPSILPLSPEWPVIHSYLKTSISNGLSPPAATQLETNSPAGFRPKESQVVLS